MEATAIISLLSIFIPIGLGPFCYLVEKMSPKGRTIYAVVLGFITAGLTLSLIPRITEGTLESLLWIPGAGKIHFSLCVDAFSVYVAIVAGVIGALVLLYSTRYMEEAAKEYSLSRYYWQALLFIGGMIGLALSANLLVMYIFWEIIGFCSYALIAYYYRDPEPVPAGIKAFIVTRIGDIGFLAGILVLWSATGSLNIFEIIPRVGDVSPALLSLAAAGFIAGALGKSAQFPLHVWLPDAMVAPSTITALIHAACLVNAGIYVLARSFPIFVGLAWWPLVIIWIGAITAFMAATIALTEWDLKRVLAYSTISQLGYMMAAVGAGAVLASQFHLISHGLFKALLFLGAGSIMHMTGGAKDLDKLGGLSKYMPITHVTFSLGLLALVGIPVCSGFFSKDMIMTNLLGAGAYAYGPLVLLIIAAFFTAAYSWRMYWLAFHGKKRISIEIKEAPLEMTVPLIILAAGSMLFGFYISPYTSNMIHSLPDYPVTHISLAALFHHSFTSPIIWITLGIVIFLIILTFIWRATVLSTYQKPSAVTLPLVKAYWIDIAYSQAFLKYLLRFCETFRRLQTGDLNFNHLSIVIGLLVFLTVLLASGL